MQHVLPRHLQIILRINQEFLELRGAGAPRATSASCAGCR